MGWQRPIRRFVRGQDAVAHMCAIIVILMRGPHCTQRRAV
ncbi:hypothetical protein I551_5604 [Mycobacterium ulcerans str. Harvey]|uniref:Transposase n=1 Tax=Mycobacterium ulcerans str. Harvey TaxID=1299332 RepID=A0ABN0QTP7_MYCUL|nr:hypothetical protein I551_5604 [Mycobacterium ulcerans str. Harvey]